MKIALYGYGKMGKAIEKLAIEKGHEIVLKIDADNAESISTADLQKADVAIEFSQPDLAKNHIQKCFEAQVPIVIGTTGWYQHYDALKQECIDKNAAFLAATNFSVGVNIFFALNKHLASIMSNKSDYQVSVEEIHHTEKLDAPSGTAITIAEGIIENYPNIEKWVLDKSNQLSHNEINIAAKRIPNVPGTHEVFYQSAIDEISIKHTAHSRDGFALGAILAAEFLKDKKGVYNMQDVLKL